MKQSTFWIVTAAISILVALTSCAPQVKTITVGAKNTAEQHIVSDMIADLLAKNGFQVTRQFSTGSPTARDALRAAQIDLYPEYTGTAWSKYLKQTAVLSDPRQLYEAVKGADAILGVAWLDRFSLNNTDGLAIKKSDVARYGTSISSLASYARSKPGVLRFGVDPEFQGRNDGFEQMAAAYSLPLNKNEIATMDVGLTYKALDQKQIDVAMISSTDGLLKKYDLEVLQDDQRFFPSSNLAITVRQVVFEKYPEIATILKPLSEKLDNNTMQQLNADVDVQNMDPETVAKETLAKWGLLP